MDSQITQFIRATRGAPISILTVFVLENRGLGHNFLVRSTGYSKDTVTQALKVLSALDLIEPIPGSRYNGWMVTEKVPIIFGVKSSPIFQDSPYPFGLLSERNVETDYPEIVINSNYAQRVEIIQALHSAGIRGSTANQIALDSKITLEYVTRMILENDTTPVKLAKRILRHDQL